MGGDLVKGKEIQIDLKKLPNKVILMGIVAVSLVFAAYLLVSGGDSHASRQIKGMQLDVRQLQGELEAAQSLPLLARVEDNWVTMHKMAKVHAVELIPLEPTIDKPYEGPVGAWHWVVKGRLHDIANYIMAVQSAIPVVVGEMAYQSGNATVSLSILGSL